MSCKAKTSARDKDGVKHQKGMKQGMGAQDRRTQLHDAIAIIFVAQNKNTKVQTLGAKRASCSIAVCWAARH